MTELSRNVEISQQEVTSHFLGLCSDLLKQISKDSRLVRESSALSGIKAGSAEKIKERLLVFVKAVDETDGTEDDMFFITLYLETLLDVFKYLPTLNQNVPKMRTSIQSGVDERIEGDLGAGIQRTALLGQVVGGTGVALSVGTGQLWPLMANAGAIAGLEVAKRIKTPANRKEKRPSERLKNYIQSLVVVGMLSAVPPVLERGMAVANGNYEISQTEAGTAELDAEVYMNLGLLVVQNILMGLAVVWLIRLNQFHRNTAQAYFTTELLENLEQRSWDASSIRDMKRLLGKTKGFVDLENGSAAEPGTESEALLFLHQTLHLFEALLAGEDQDLSLPAALREAEKIAKATKYKLKSDPAQATRPPSPLQNGGSVIPSAKPSREERKAMYARLKAEGENPKRRVERVLEPVKPAAESTNFIDAATEKMQLIKRLVFNVSIDKNDFQKLLSELGFIEDTGKGKGSHVGYVLKRNGDSMTVFLPRRFKNITGDKIVSNFLSDKSLLSPEEVYEAYCRLFGDARTKQCFQAVFGRAV